MLFFISTLFFITLLLALTATIWLRHHKQEKKFLLPALVLMTIFICLDQLLYSFPDKAHIFIPLRLSVQLLLCPAWLLFSVSYARVTSLAHFKRTDIYLFALSLAPFALSVFLPTSAFYYQTDFQAEPIIFLEQASFYLYLYITVIYIIAIGNLESTLRNSQHNEKWRIKISIYGIGISLVALMLFASQGLLYMIIDMRHAILRNAILCLGALLMLYSEWKRQSSETLISRKVAFRSVVAVIAGVYLVGLGLAREGNRVMGDNFTQTVLIIAATLILGTIICLAVSRNLRRILSIWIQRNFYDEKYDYRAQWMQFSEYLSQAMDYHSLIRASLMSFCETFGRIGAIYIPLDTDNPTAMGQAFYYEIDKNSGIDVTEEDFHQLLQLESKPHFVNDTDLHAFGPQTIMALLRMQMGIVLPIRVADAPEGLLLLGHPINGKEMYDNEDFDLMEAMGRQIGLSAKSFRVSEEMALNREIQAFDKLGTFVLHDLKNQVYTLSLLTNNARNFIADPKFQTDMVGTLSNTVDNMKSLINQLPHVPHSDNLQLEQVYLQDLAQSIAKQIPDAPITIKGKNPTATLDSEQMSKVFLNLYLNALEAGSNKPITVIVGENEGIPFFQVQDMAGGLSDKVLEKGLFKPFNTTKPRGMGIGLFHTRKILKAHGAEIIAENRPGEGCTFIVRFLKEVTL